MRVLRERGVEEVVVGLKRCAGLRRVPSIARVPLMELGQTEIVKPAKNIHLSTYTERKEYIPHAKTPYELQSQPAPLESVVPHSTESSDEIMQIRGTSLEEELCLDRSPICEENTFDSKYQLVLWVIMSH